MEIKAKRILIRVVAAPSIWTPTVIRAARENPAVGNAVDKPDNLVYSLTTAIGT